MFFRLREMLWNCDNIQRIWWQEDVCILYIEYNDDTFLKYHCEEKEFDDIVQQLGR